MPVKLAGAAVPPVRRLPDRHLYLIDCDGQRRARRSGDDRSGLVIREDAGVSDQIQLPDDDFSAGRH